MTEIPNLHAVRTYFRDIHWWLVFGCIWTCYALLILPTINRLGMGWDEATDMVIAQAYQSPENMLLGLSWDESQTRLPMFTVAMVFMLFGTSNLFLARVTTVIVGAITLLGIFIYGKERFLPVTGVLAAGLLAINPFFISFAKMAFTESDMFVACALTWLLVTLSRLEKKPSLGWAMLCGICLGLAISSKAIALVIVPVAAGSFVLSQAYRKKSANVMSMDRSDHKPALVVLLWSCWTILISIGSVLIAWQLNAGSQPQIFHLLNYGFLFLGWLITLIWVIRNRHVTSHPIALAAFMAGFGLLTFVIIPPEHLANTEIFRSLIARADQEMIFSPGFILELAALHTSILFLKSTPVLGFGLLAGFVIGLTQWRRHELNTPLLLVAAYFLTLLSLPLGQTFYSIPLLPILSLLAADQIIRLVSLRRTISIILIVVGLFWWAAEVRQIYPDFHLNGYQWLGERPFMGRSSIGGRSIVFTPLDGMQQAVGWLDMHAKVGQVALIYGAPPYIIEVLVPNPTYRLIYGPPDSLDSEPDYVVVHIGSIIRQGDGIDTPLPDIFEYPFELDTLQRDYEKVYSLKRAFELEVVSVWQLK